MDEFVWTMRTMLKAWPHNYFHMASRGEVKNLVSSIDRFKMPFPAQMGYLDAKCIGTLWKKVTAFARLSVHQSLLHSFFLFFLFLFWFAIDPKGKKKRKGLRNMYIRWLRFDKFDNFGATFIRLIVIYDPPNVIVTFLKIFLLSRFLNRERENDLTRILTNGFFRGYRYAPFLQKENRRKREIEESRKKIIQC